MRPRRWPTGDGHVPLRPWMRLGDGRQASGDVSGQERSLNDEEQRQYSTVRAHSLRLVAGMTAAAFLYAYSDVLVIDGSAG